MGVDAVMIVRLTEHPSDRTVQQWSYRLAEAVGADHFFVDDDDAAIAKAVAKGRPPRRALNLCTPEDYSYSLRGMDSEDGSSHLDVSLGGRFYGPGYERGDPWVYLAVAEWVERNLPNATVFYGGDSDTHLDPFDRPAREALVAHWATHGGRPYRGSMWSGGAHPLQPTCPLCSEKAAQFGSGGGYAAWTCLGCARHWVWVTGYAAPKAFPPSRDFSSFKAADELRAAVKAA